MTPASVPDLHSEQANLVNASMLQVSPRALGASRTFCPDCRGYIVQSGTFCCSLGYPRSMNGIGFQTLMLRGTEWAATGQVTIPIPANWPELGSPQAEELKKGNAPLKPKQPAKKAE